MSLLSHLSALESAGLVRVAQVTPDLEYIFRHTLVQDAVYASILEEDRVRLHREVGEALEKLYADHLDDLAATLAVHFEKAGDAARALAYYTRAAAKALATFANQEAENHYRSAYQLTQDPEKQAVLLSGLGEALFQQSRYEEAIKAWQGAILQYHALSLEEAIARLYARSARAAWFFDPPWGLRICQEGLQMVDHSQESPGLAMLVHEAARAYYFNGFPDEASRLCRRALSMSRRLENVEVRADALATLGILQDTPPEDALIALEQAIELAEANGLLHIATRASLNLGTLIKSVRGDLPAAGKHFHHSADLARRRGSIQEEFLASIGIAEVAVHQGELQEAEIILKKVESLPNPDSARMIWSTIRAGLLLMQGKFTEAIHITRSGLAEARQRGDLQLMVSFISGFVEANFALDSFQKITDWGDVEAALADALEASDRGIADKIWICSQYSLLKVHQGKIDEAHHWFEQTRLAAAEGSTLFYDLVIDQTAVELALAENRWDDAIKYLRNLADHKAQLSYFYAGWMNVLWADALMSRGRPADLEQAQFHLLEALPVFEKLGAEPYQRLVKEKIQRSREQTLAQAIAQESVTKELAQAGLLQESFLPEQLPSLPGWQISAILKPARATSGDFYDFITLPNGNLGVVIADVTDKGMGAALFMASSRTLLRLYAADFPEQPEEVLRSVNRQITQNTRGGLYVTLFYAILDPVEKRMLYCNAGHNPPFLIRSAHSVEELAGTGIPLGILPDASWQVGQAQCSTGSALILYTDGVTEACDKQERLFGSERLIEAAQQAVLGSHSNAQAIQEAILQSLTGFSQGAPQSDDITLVILTCE